MRRSFTLMLLASFAIVLFLCTGSGAIASDCAPSKLLDSLPMERTPGSDAMSVTASIEGHSEKLLIDSGAMPTQIWRTTAANLDYPLGMGSQTYIDYSGRFSEDNARVAKFTLGSMNTGGFHIHISPNPSVVLTGVDGILGNDMMVHDDMDFDFAHQELNFFAPEQCEGANVYWNPSTITSVQMAGNFGLAFVPVTLDDHVIVALLDTSADKTFLNPYMAHKLFGLKPGAVAAGEIADGGTAIKSGTHTFSRLTLGGLTVTNPQIAIPLGNIPVPHETMTKANLSARYPPLYLPDLMPDMVIGMDVLKHSHLYISFENQRVYVSAAGDGPALTPAPTKASWFNVRAYPFHPVMRTYPGP
jgi:Aspartyl protease